MNNIRRKLMAYFNLLNNEDMKPCIVLISKDLANRSVNAVYCDTPQPSTYSEWIDFYCNHKIIYLRDSVRDGNTDRNASRTIYLDPNSRMRSPQNSVVDDTVLIGVSYTKEGTGTYSAPNTKSVIAEWNSTSVHRYNWYPLTGSNYDPNQ